MNEEIERRAELLAKALAARDEQAKAIEKIKPDQVNYGPDGVIAMTSFSKAKYDELKKAKDQLAKIDKAIAKAINEANYDDLSKLNQ